MPYALRIRFEGQITPPSLNHYTAIGTRGSYLLNGQPATLRAAFTPSTGLPAWVPAMDTLAVISQNTLAAVDPCPTGVCAYEAEGSYERILTAWNSGFFSPDYSQLGAFGVCGGGDADYWGNQVTVFPLETRQWVRVNSPSPAASVANETYVRTGAGAEYGEWPDGTPAMPHTYGNMAYMPPAMGGGNKGSVILPWKTFYFRQSSTGHGHKCDLETGTWSRASSVAGAGAEGSFALDTTRNRYVGTVTGTGSAYQTRLRIFGPFTNGVAAHSTVGADHFGLGGYATSDYIPTLDVLIQYGTDQFSVRKLRGYDLTSATGAYYDLTTTGDALPAMNGCGMAWVADVGALYLMSPATLDRQYMWKVVPPASNWQTAAWTVTRITMAGVTVADTPTSNGMWQRLRYAPSIKSLLWVNSINGPVYCYRIAQASATLTAQTTTAPITGNAAVIAPGAKHLSFAFSSGRWWKMAGDHKRDDIASTEYQDGRQEIYSFRVLQNDWRRDQRYYIYDPSQVQIFEPDDAFSVAMPGNEIWVFRSTGVHTAPTYPLLNAESQSAAEQVEYAIMAYNTDTLRWRKVRACEPANITTPGDEWRYGRSWRAFYDGPRDRILIPVEFNGINVFQVRGSDGADITARKVNGWPVVYTLADLYQWTPDPTTRYAYAMDWGNGNFHRINLDNFNEITQLMTFPNEVFYNPTGASNMTRHVRQVWHPGLRAVVVLGNQINVYEVDTGVLTQLPRQDYFQGVNKLVYASEAFYDADSGFIVSIGMIDWDGAPAPAHYFKMALSRG